jgi:hypothetical protein
VSQARRISERLPLAASHLVDLHLFDRGVSVIPAYVRPAPRFGLFADQHPEGDTPIINLSSPVWHSLKGYWNLRSDPWEEDARRLILQLFDATLGIAHSPQYQLDHQDALAHDWLRLPIPKDRASFQRIAELGADVRTLLDPMVDATAILRTVLGADRRTLAVPSSSQKDVLRDDDLVISISYFGAARGGWHERAFREQEASRPAWGDTTGDLFLNESAYLANVPRQVWRYELGGYPVIKKWLGYRDQKRHPGRPLTMDEIDHLRGIVHRIAALLLLHERLDQAYEEAIEDAFTLEDLGL